MCVVGIGPVLCYTIMTIQYAITSYCPPGAQDVYVCYGS